MSMMRCSSCDGYVDTDYDGEGVWDVMVLGSDKKKDFVCGACCEEYMTEDEVFDPDLPEKRAYLDKGDSMAAMAEGE